MDIFTTQLTRVVPVKIKTEQLKVKALVKDAAASKLSDDPDHLENHDYYFDSDSQLCKSAQEKSDNDGSATPLQNDNISSEQESKEDQDEHPHLDIYV